MSIVCTPDSVHYPMTLTYINPDGAERDMRATLGWNRTDPAAVVFSIESRGDWVDWFFARSLLSDGLEVGVGAGDVRIRPIGPGVIGISLVNPSGQAHFAADARVLREFLAASYLRLPEGYEFAHCDIDAELADLIESEAA